MASLSKLAHGDASGIAQVLNELSDMRVLSGRGNIMLPELPSMVEHMSANTICSLKGLVRLMATQSVQECGAEFGVLASLLGLSKRGLQDPPWPWP